MKLKNNILFCFVCLFVFVSCEGQNNNNNASGNNISVEKAEEMRHDDEVIVLDVRTDSEFNSGHIPNARQIDYNSNNFEEKVGMLDKNKTYLVYCRTGSRSSKASKIMAEQGFENLYHIDGGFSEWKKNNLPIEE